MQNLKIGTNRLEAVKTQTPFFLRLSGQKNSSKVNTFTGPKIPSKLLVLIHVLSIYAIVEALFSHGKNKWF